MVLSNVVSDVIVSTSYEYLGKSFDLDTFNCVHFVREVYKSAGVVMPILARYDFPPREFHLSNDEFNSMPIGHSVFFKRRSTRSTRPWTHVAIIVSSDTLIHCTQYIGKGVMLTSKSVFMETYDLSPIYLY